MRLFITLITVVLLSTKALAGGSAGWRMDGTGSFPNTKAPTEWAEDKNIIWKTALPQWSNASPAPAGNKLFICMEPDILACVSAENGSILWQKSVSFKDVLPTEEFARMEEATKKVGELNKEKNQLRKELKNTDSQLKKNKGDKALAKKKDDLVARIKEIDSQLKPLKQLVKPGAHKVNGYTSPTPVTDGKHVAVIFGTGIAACFDLDGNMTWAALVEKPQNGWGNSASPLLINDKLIVHVINVYALDINSGKILWKAPSKAHWGSPIHASWDNTDLVITTNGDMIRASDGAVLSTETGSLTYCAPIFADGKIYTIQNNGKAVQLPEKLGDNTAVKALWTTTPHKDRYYASPILYKGLIYAITRSGQLSVIDEKDGSIVYTQKLSLGGTTFPSITLVGDSILVSSDTGKTLVFKPGREFKEIRTNQLGPFRSTPLVVGDRIYIRGLKDFYCIASQ